MIKDEILHKFSNFLKKISIDNSNTFSMEEDGVVVDVNSYIVIARGFTKISYREFVLINGEYRGIVEIIRDDLVKIILLDKTNNINVGDKVKRTYSRFSVPVGDILLGRVLNGLIDPIDGNGSINAFDYYPVERCATPIINRKSIKEPLQTGIKIIDSLIPIGKGQRELIIGDRQTGKTSIAIDTIINQKNKDVICIYCSIGQRDSSISNVIKTLDDNDALKYTIVIHAGGNEMAGHQFVAPYSATSIAEYFMQKGKHVLIVYDDLSKHAKAYREVSLLLGKNPGREAYPPDIFYIHSRLLERSTKMKDEFGGGSITSLPIVETEAENISSYIPTNVISITDGQIYLSPTLFQKGILPAVDISKSVSRVGSSAQFPAYKEAVSTLGIEYSQFEELESFSKFSTTLDGFTEKIIKKGEIIREILKQNINDTLEIYEQIAIFFCLNNDVFTDVDSVKKVHDVAKMIINNDFKDIVDIINSYKKIPNELIESFIRKVKNNLID